MNVPFSCCKSDSKTSECYHLKINDLIIHRQNAKFQVFPPINVDKLSASESLKLDKSCPELIFEAVQWEFFIFVGIIFVIIGKFEDDWLLNFNS